MTAEEPIRLNPYDPNWPLKFEREKKVLEQALGPWVFGGIEHVGSTSVPELTAKPTVDIMVGVKNLAEAKACIPLLESSGYVYAEYRPEIMHWFCKPSAAHREFHLYLMEYDTPEWKQRTGFRDYLRAHPETAQEYLDMKKSWRFSLKTIEKRTRKERQRLLRGYQILLFDSASDPHSFTDSKIRRGELIMLVMSGF